MNRVSCKLARCYILFAPKVHNQVFCSPKHQLEHWERKSEKIKEGVEPKRKHYGNADKSDRLKRVLDLLRDGMPHTTMSIAKECNVCNPSTIISELRFNGYKIPPAKLVRRRKDGTRIYTYQLKG